MSIKIYNGFILDPAIRSIQDLDTLVTSFRVTAKPIADDIIFSAFISDAVKAMDQLTVGLRVEDDMTPLQYAYHRMEKAHEEISKGYRDPRYDPSTSVAFMHHPDGRTFGILFTESNHMREAWFAHSKSTDYDYWDSTDGPEELSEADWKKRRKDWNTVLLNRGGVPANCGITAQIHDLGWPPRPKQLSDEIVNRYVEPLSKRARYLACVTFERPTPPADDKESPVFRYMADLHEAERNGTIDREQERLSSLIIPSPSLADLQRAPGKRA